MTKILGLTGGIASGKTTVSNYFKSLNIDLIDADLIAREVMRAGQPIVKEIANEFGEEILLPNGEINRNRLGDIVFDSDLKRKKLNNIVQMEIREKIKKQKRKLLNKNNELIILDIPLLYEEKYENLVDEVMVVYVDADTQKKRLMKRDQHLSEEDALKRIESQMDLAEKIKRADFVIDNNQTINYTIEQVNNCLRELVHLN